MWAVNRIFCVNRRNFFYIIIFFFFLSCVFSRAIQIPWSQMKNKQIIFKTHHTSLNLERTETTIFPLLFLKKKIPSVFVITIMLKKKSSAWNQFVLPLSSESPSILQAQKYVWQRAGWQVCWIRYVKSKLRNVTRRNRWFKINLQNLMYNRILWRTKFSAAN